MILDWSIPLPTLAGFLALSLGDAQAAMAWIEAWLVRTYATAPALVLGLGAIVAVPPLALAGLLLSRGLAPKPRLPLAASDTGPEFHRAQGYLDVLDGSARRVALTASITRIGREDDNDIALTSAKVHRYHAVLERTDDGDFVLSDMSGPDGNGVYVDGERHRRVTLKPGQRIGIGDVRLTFGSH